MRIIKKSIDKLVPFKVKAINLSTKQMQDLLFSFGCGWTGLRSHKYINCGTYFFVDSEKRMYYSLEGEYFKYHEYQEISEEFLL